MSCGLALATTPEGSVCRRQQGRCWSGGEGAFLNPSVAAAGSHLPCLADAVLLARGCRGWDPIFPCAKWVTCTHPPQLLS